MISPLEWLRKAGSRSPRGVALAIGCLASLALLLAGEVAARLLGRGVERPTVLRGGCRADLEERVQWSRPDCDEEFSRLEQGKALFRVRVSTDSSGRRVIPGQVKDASSQVVFFGCSVTWGWGLEAWQTLPAVFQAERSDVSVWNLAVQGLGPHDALAQLDHAEVMLRGVDRGKPTRAFYVFIPDHIARASGDAFYVRTWGAMHPRFVLKADGSLRRKGVFFDDPLRRFVTHLQDASQLSRALVPRLKFNTDAYRMALTVAILRELRSRFVSMFQRGDLTLVAFPSRNAEEGRRLTAASRAAGLEVLDYSTLERRDLLPIDYHPDAETAARVARALARDVPRAPWEGLPD